MQTSTLKAMLEVLDSGEEFSIGFRTCDVERGTGGEYIAFKRARKCMKETSEQLREKKLQEGLPVNRCNPNHQPNSTRNIVVLPGGNIIKIHLRLVRRFNRKTLI